MKTWCDSVTYVALIRVLLVCFVFLFQIQLAEDTDE